MKNTVIIITSLLVLILAFHLSQPHQVVVASSSVRPVMPAVPAGTKLAGVPTPKSLNDQINKHMQDMELKQSFKRISAELTWEDAQNDMPETMPIDEPEAKVLDVSVQDTASRVYADLNPDEKGMRTVLPSERIQSKLAHREWTKEYDHSLRREYVHAFIDNMQKEGYQIKLNDNLEVVGVVQKRKLNQLSIDQALEKAISVPR